jgi:hypothetical protein
MSTINCTINVTINVALQGIEYDDSSTDVAQVEPEGLTAERLRELLDYDPETGIFTWRANRGRARAGMVAGYLARDGYRLIEIDGHPYQAHRLAWLYVFGEWPEGYLDHRDCDRDNNAIDNLRTANRHQNAGNSRISKRNTSGYKGVSWHKRDRKWQAQIYRDGKACSLGYFDDPEEAHEAYMDAAREYWGEFASAGVPEPEDEDDWAEIQTDWREMYEDGDVALTEDEREAIFGADYYG